MKSLAVIVLIMALTVLSCQKNQGEKRITRPESEDKPVETILSGTNWLVEDIAGRGMIDNSQATIRFDEGGRVSGSTGCNLFNGTATIQGNTIKFGQLATTRRACVPSLMDQEQRFLKAIGEVRSFAMGQNGLLHLYGPNSEPLLRLSPMEESTR